MTTEFAGDARLEAEAALVAAAQLDPAAFAPLYEAYVDRVYRYAYRRVGNHADAEDVTAQTFQQALAALSAYEWRGLPFGAWLFRIAANVILQRTRGGKREFTVDDLTPYEDEAGVETEGDDPAAILERDAEDQELVAAVRRLPLDQQRALVLKFSRDMTAREIGASMGRSEGAVKQLVHRALRSLRSDLEEKRSV